MRWLGWACVVVGLLIGLVTVPYARTVYDVKSQTYQNLFTEAMDRKDYRAASEYAAAQRNLQPEYAGGLIGGGCLMGFGVLLLAIRRKP